jgi:stage V sporulation protein SpoVS
MRSWVRKLSGAEKNADEVRQAVLAGSVRRGYLKGVGLQLGCQPPAAPSGVTLPTAAKAKKR